MSLYVVMTTINLCSSDYTQLANTLILTNTVILSNLSNGAGALAYLEDEIRLLGSNVSAISRTIDNTTYILNYTTFECEYSWHCISDGGGLGRRWWWSLV